jgi:hypothetical protein
MSKTVVVRYETRPEAADDNQRLIEAVFDRLASDDPGGLRYAVFRLADGVTFVHVAIVEGETTVAAVERVRPVPTGPPRPDRRTTRARRGHHAERLPVPDAVGTT